MRDDNPHRAQANLDRIDGSANIDPRIPAAAPRPGFAIDDVTAVIVDWNLPEHTVRCVRSLVGDGVPPHRIVVVENGPTEEQWTRIGTELPICVLVRVPENVGFTAATNIGASVLPGRAYLLVNNDAFVHRKGSVSTLVNAVAKPGVGVAVPRLLNPDLSLQPTVAPFTIPLVALARASGLSRLVPNRWQPGVGTHWDHSESRTIQAAIGAVMIVDGRAWDELGGFREAGFMYTEDLDLCWRAREHGWSTWFDADGEFVHLGGASSDRRWAERERAERIGYAEAEMIRKHLSGWRAASTLALMRAGLVGRVAYFRLVGNAGAATSCRGFLQGLGSKRLVGAEAPTSAPRIEVVRPGQREAAAPSP